MSSIRRIVILMFDLDLDFEFGFGFLVEEFLLLYLMINILERV